MKHLISSLLLMMVFFSFSSSDIVIADISSGLVAYFPFNGDAEDASGNGLHGTLISGGYARNRFSRENYALSGYVEIPDHSMFDLTEAFTLSAWIKIEAIDSAFNCWIGKDYSTAFAAGIYAGGSGDCPADASVVRPAVLYIGDQSAYFHGATNFSCGTDTWYHVAITFEDATDTIQLFVNGILDDTMSHTETITTNDFPLGIGRDGRHGDTFTGSIDNVRIYNRVLSSSDIEELYNFTEPDESPEGSDSGGGCFIEKLIH